MQTKIQKFNLARKQGMIFELKKGVTVSKSCKVVNFKPVWTYFYKDKEYRSEFELFKDDLGYFYRELGDHKRFCIE